MADYFSAFWQNVFRRFGRIFFGVLADYFSAFWQIIYCYCCFSYSDFNRSGNNFLLFIHYGNIAVELFTSHEAGYYSAIFLDMMMPELDGLEATKQIRNSGHEDATTIPIIALTANAFDEDIKRSLEAGLNDHLLIHFAFEDACFLHASIVSHSFFSANLILCSYFNNVYLPSFSMITYLFILNEGLA